MNLGLGLVPEADIDVSRKIRIRRLCLRMIVLLLTGSAAAKLLSWVMAGDDGKAVQLASSIPLPPVAQQLGMSALEFAMALGAMWAGPRMATFLVTLWLGGMMGLGRAILSSFLPQDAPCGCLGFWPGVRIELMNNLSLLVLGTLLFSASIGLVTHLFPILRCKRN